jgi:hypothetical protein
LSEGKVSKRRKETEDQRKSMHDKESVIRWKWERKTRKGKARYDESKK